VAKIQTERLPSFADHWEGARRLSLDQQVEDKARAHLDGSGRERWARWFGRRRQPAAAPPTDIRPFKIISWNLLRVTGASLDDVITLIRRENPDLVLMQEASEPIDRLPARLGGDYARAPLPGRIHGPAYWSPTKLPNPARVLQLPSGSLVHRVCQVLDLGSFAVANVHLSHGQLLNRRQLRCIAEVLPAHAAVLGDYNLVGPALLPGFRDVGPRHSTHMMGDILPIRIDRCLVRGLTCVQTKVLPRGVSDHRPIVVHLAVAAEGRSLAA
jgi:endonuclease/exonuclease/phosphatase (EEP) superfamily protein YafD